MISKEQLSQIMPRASAESLERYYQPLNEAMEKFHIDNPKKVAMFLAQLAHESDSFRFSSENLNYSAQGLMKTWPRIFPTLEIANLYARKPEKIASRAYGNRMGNGSESTADGWKFRGRGLIGITGRTNYEACGKGIGADLLNHPELLEGPEYATASAAWFWNKYVDGIDPEDIEKVTRKINGGLIGLDSRKAFWEVAKRVVIIFLLFFFVGCSPAIVRVKRHWNKIQEELLKHPELADSLNLVKHDTVRVKGFEDRFEERNDSTSWDTDFFAAVDTLVHDVIVAEKKALPVTRLQHKICPTIKKDSVYHIKIYNSDISLWVPILLEVRSDGSKISIKIKADDVKMPDPQIIKSLEFKPVAPKFYLDQWFWAFVITLSLFAGFVVVTVRNKRP